MIMQMDRSWNVTIHMAGDIVLAGQVIQRHLIEHPGCVTLTPQSFIYTGGREEGFAVGFIHYPRFPVSHLQQITDKARALALVLIDALGQHSFCIVAPDITYWHSRWEGSE